ncbi:MAG: glycosyltransferase family 2 protein [Burkholderiaceae bacterium]|nr:glycosyltransferase family 2 protein [Burkholderiaceae bacterium]
MPYPDYAGALSVVVPVRNEAENVLPLIEEIHAALEGHADFEVIYVDDGSTDDTPQRLAEAGRRFPRLRVLRHARSCGQSTAIATAVRAARHPWIATLDGDGQNDPADIPLLLDRVRAGQRSPGLALVAGWRTRRQDTIVRKISSRVANRVRGGLLGDRTPDTGCGLKVFPRDLFLRLPFFDHLHRFLPALVLREGQQVVSVPVRHRERVAGQSKYGIGNRLWVGIVDLMGVMWLNRRMKRPEIETT